MKVAAEHNAIPRLRQLVEALRQLVDNSARALRSRDFMDGLSALRRGLSSSMLARDPQARPTAVEVRVQLGDRVGGSGSVVVVGAPFIGRERELARIRAALVELEKRRGPGPRRDLGARDRATIGAAEIRELDDFQWANLDTVELLERIVDAITRRLDERKVVLPIRRAGLACEVTPLVRKCAPDVCASRVSARWSGSWRSVRRWLW